MVDLVVKAVAGEKLVNTLDEMKVHEVTTNGNMTIYDFKYICRICREKSGVSTKKKKRT